MAKIAVTPTVMSQLRPERSFCSTVGYRKPTIPRATTMPAIMVETAERMVVTLLRSSTLRLVTETMLIRRPYMGTPKQL